MTTRYRGEEIVESQSLVVETCCSCHVLFAMPNSLQRRGRTDASVWFYCPNGHRQHYTSELDKVERLEKEKRQLEDAKSRLLRQRDDAQSEAEHQKAVARGYKGAMVQTKKRAAKGVCPVAGCRRHFVDVQRHIASKHPGWDGEPTP